MEIDARSENTASWRHERESGRLVLADILLSSSMFEFTSFRHPPDNYSIKNAPDDVDMDEDDDDFLETGGLKLTCPGESLTSAQAYMRYANCMPFGIYSDAFTSGHGTYVDKEEVIASVCGLVERVNKLITVRAVRTR